MSKNSSIAIVAGVAIAVAIIASVMAFSGVSDNSMPMDTPEVDQTNLVSQEEKLTVLTSFYPYHEFTKNVAGDFAQVKQFMPSGVEAHDWEPRAQEIQSLNDADVFVYNGLGMEPYVENIIGSGEFDNVLFVKASEGVELLKFEDDHDDHDEHAKEDEHDEHDEHGVASDPHIWLNPNLVKIQVKNIAERLSEIDPENSKSYNENALQYIEKLELLDLQIREELSSCSKKDFITFHNAFSYFSDEYGLTQHTITKGVHDHSATPTAKSIEDVIDLAKELNLSVIFAEDTSDIRISQVIADEIGADVLILSPVATEDVENKNYFERMQQNASNLKKALCN